jgi:transcriptional regulator with XRE-family HTH domain
LHRLRELAVLTQVELAEKVEVSSITVSHWETGNKRPRVSNIRKLVTVLNVSPQEIIAALDEAALSRQAPGFSLWECYTRLSEILPQSR